MAAPPGHTAGEGAAQRAGISTAGPPARSAPAGRQTGAAAAPGPGGRSCREAGAERRETGEAAARGRGQRGLAGPRPLFMARPPPAAGSLAKRPRRCRARGAVAVTVRARSRTRARQRCGTRPSPSPARPAASALSAEGAAATATTALGPARPSGPRYRDTRAGPDATSAGPPLRQRFL
nr:transcription initiation factor TFIID subunit 4-like [Equus asinus]